MAGPISGIDGDVEFGGGQVCETLSWSIDPTGESVTFNSNCTGPDTDEVPTIKSWTAEVIVATVDGKCPTVAVHDVVVLALNTADVASKGCTWAGSALVVGIPVEVTINAAADLVAYSISFKGKGPITPTNNP